MNKLLFFSLTFLGIIFYAEAKKLKGQIIYINDTVNVTFNIPVSFLTQEPNYEKLQQKVTYFDASGIKKVLKADDAKEIRFQLGHEEIRMLSRENSIGLGSIFNMNSNVFLRIEIDGNLKLFSYSYTQQYPGMYNGSTGVTTGGSYRLEKFALQKGERTLKVPADLTFRKDMSDYFNDCPDLVRKIENKEFRKNDLKAIVKFYNEYCQ